MDRIREQKHTYLLSKLLLAGGHLATVWILILILLFPLSADAVEPEDPAQGLSLSEAISTVLEKSPLSSVAQNGALAAEQARKAARGEFLPKVKAQYNYTRLSETPSASFGGIEMDFGSQDQSTIQGRVEQPLFTGFALVSQYRTAKLGEQQAAWDEQAIRQDLILQTHEAYFGVLLAERNLDVAEQAVAQLTSHAEVAKQFYENGTTPKNDLLKALVQLADTKRNRIEAMHQLDLARSQMNILLQREVQAPLKLKEALVYRPYKRSLEESISLAMTHHSDLLTSKLNIDKAKQGVNLSRSGLFPNVALVGSMQHEEGTFSEEEDTLSATLHAEWALWEWGSNFYKVKESKSQLLMAKAQYANQVDMIKLQVQRAYLEIEEWRQAIEVAKTSIEQAKENYRITEEQYKESITTSTEVLDAQTLLDQSQVNYYSALSNYNIAIARLERAMGILTIPGEN